VRTTRSVVDLAHWVGASVEGELGAFGSLETGEGEKEDGHGAEGKLSHDQLLTDPAQAEDFVAKTKVGTALAIAMGTSHGAYKFTRKPDGARSWLMNASSQVNFTGGSPKHTFEAAMHWLFFSAAKRATRRL
jgi:fructose/tagatose bisphosphate aldolase